MVSGILVNGNKAIVCKLGWQIAQDKEYFWVKWVNFIYIKGAPWQSYEAQTTTIWAWKMVCKAKNDVSNQLNCTQWMQDSSFSILKLYKRLCAYVAQVQWSNVFEISTLFLNANSLCGL